MEPTATDAELNAAFRKRAVETHPDKPENHGKEDEFKDVNEAYQILADPKKRLTYDQYGESATGTKTIDEQAQEQLTASIMACIDQLDAKQVDVISLVRQNIVINKNNFNKSASNADAQAAKWRDAAARLKRKRGGDNPVTIAFLATAEMQVNIAKGCRYEADKCGIVLKLLDEYEWKRDQPPESQNHFDAGSLESLILRGPIGMWGV